MCCCEISHTVHLHMGNSGTVPFIFHVDGAEFYTNSEYLVWSFSSALTSGDVRWLHETKLALSTVCVRDGRL